MIATYTGLMATASETAAPVSLELVGGKKWDLLPFIDVSISAGAIVLHLWSQLLIIWVRRACELFNPDLRTSFFMIQPIFCLYPDCPTMIRSRDPKWFCAMYEYLWII